MSITPAHCRSMRRREIVGISALAEPQHVLDQRQAAALGIRVVAVEIAAQHQPALVGLADVEMRRAVGDDAVDHRLQRLGDEGLQHVGLDRQAQPGQGRDWPVWPATASPTLPARIGPRVVSTPTTRAVLEDEAGDLAFLDDVDAERVGGAGIAPGDRVVARGAAAPLEQRADDREAGVVRIVEIRQRRMHLVAVEQFGVDAVAAA